MACQTGTCVLPGSSHSPGCRDCEACAPASRRRCSSSSSCRQRSQPLTAVVAKRMHPPPNAAAPVVALVPIPMQAAVAAPGCHDRGTDGAAARRQRLGRPGGGARHQKPVCGPRQQRQGGRQAAVLNCLLPTTAGCCADLVCCHAQPLCLGCTAHGLFGSSRICPDPARAQRVCTCATGSNSPCPAPPSSLPGALCHRGRHPAAGETAAGAQGCNAASRRLRWDTVAV